MKCIWGKESNQVRSSVREISYRLTERRTGRRADQFQNTILMDSGELNTSKFGEKSTTQILAELSLHMSMESNDVKK